MYATTDLIRLHERVRVGSLLERTFGPEAYWRILDPVVKDAPGMERARIGRSSRGRPLYLFRYGRGGTRVLLFTQMHGDEPTGTMAVADLLRFLVEQPDHALAKRWKEELTLLIVPLLNPDGAARMQRHNAQGVDLNRDARTRFSPEIRALLGVHEEYEPTFAFNLHNEDSKTRVGETDLMAAISLLAPAFESSLGDNEQTLRAKRLCVVIGRAVEPMVGEHLARYPQSYTPTSIEAVLQARGTATVLVETGWWPEDPHLQFLRQVNFVGIGAALDAIATRAYDHMELEAYDAIPNNDTRVFDILIRGGMIVVPGIEPFRADLGLNFESALAVEGGHIAMVGDTEDYSARDILIANDLFIHAAPEALAKDDDGAYLEVGRPASFAIRKGADPKSEAVWMIDKAITRRRPGT